MKNKIKQLLEQNGPLTTHELFEQLTQIEKVAFKDFVKAIATLEGQKEIQILETGKLQIKPVALKQLEGIYRANDKGFGFVNVDGMAKDIFIPKGLTQTALSGDVVRIELIKEADTLDNLSSEAKIIEVITRHQTKLVGEFVSYLPKMIEKTGYMGYVIPSDRTLIDLTCFVLPSSLEAVDGTICVVEIKTYPSVEQPKSLEGYIVKEVGFKDAPGVDILTILHRYGVPTEFPETVLEQANAIPLLLSDKDYEGREDFRHKMIVTIDGDDAKDLDDAISLDVLEDGTFELGVHIADVSHYVTEQSPLDQQAYERGTSVYLTDRVVPMLPQRLSNGICSLHPDEERLTMSCMMTIDMSGEVISYRLVPSVIVSKKRMTYHKVNLAIVDKDELAMTEYGPFLDMLHQLRTLHFALHRKRVARGAIDFETKESKIHVDENGKPLAISLRERGLAERMIESFMLVANETVAKHFMLAKCPFMYRVHEQPSEEKMQRFMEFVTHFGVLMKGKSQDVSAKDLQRVLHSISEEPFEPVVSTVLLRSMKQARYDVQPLGHFGLGTDFYTHFTSPIRRYPDLIVHRMMKKYAGTTVPKTEYVHLTELLEDIAQQSSIMERKAVECEREVDAMKKAEFMLDKVGEVFTGMISSVTRFGVFVELDNTVEGLIHVSKMSDDHYEFLESHLMLLGKRTGKTYQIGQRVQVVVSKVDVESRDIDFEFVTSDKEKMQVNQRQKSREKSPRTKRQKKRMRSTQETKKLKKSNLKKKRR